jgi:hypothetical protein
MYFSSSFSSNLTLIASLNCMCNYKSLCNCLCNYKLFLLGATKDSHIYTHKNGWFGHKLQMHGLEWIGSLIVKIISLQSINVGRVQVFSLSLNTVAFFHIFVHNFPNICSLLCAHFKTVLWVFLGCMRVFLKYFFVVLFFLTQFYFKTFIHFGLWKILFWV